MHTLGYDNVIGRGKAVWAGGYGRCVYMGEWVFDQSAMSVMVH